MRKLVVLSVFLLGGMAVVNADEPIIDPEAVLQKLKTEDAQLEKEIKGLRDRLDVLEQRIINNKQRQLEHKARHEWQKNVRKHYLQDLEKANEKAQAKANEKARATEFRTVTD